jgi:hypothetical protein
MPYLNKRNRFVQAAKQFAEKNGLGVDEFTKADLLVVAQSINMKGIPTWVVKECRSAVSKDRFDLTSLCNPLNPSTV